MCIIVYPCFSSMNAKLQNFFGCQQASFTVPMQHPMEMWGENLWPQRANLWPFRCWDPVGLAMDWPISKSSVAEYIALNFYSISET